MPINWLKAGFPQFRAEALEDLAEEFEIEVNQDVVEGLTAAMALIAFADGVPDPDGREEILAAFEEEERLNDLDLDDLFDAFDDQAERFATEGREAQAEALATVAVFDDEPEAGRLILRAALAVTSHDGTLTPGQEEAVRRLCDALGLTVIELKERARRPLDDELEDEDED